MTHVLAVRLDNDGDVLLAGPAIRALAAGAERVTLLCGPRGRQAAAMLPGVGDVIEWRAPWIDPEPDPGWVGDTARADADALIARVAAARADRAVIFGSFHQSPLPTALLLRLAGVPWIAATSVDYPGSLLDVRHRIDDDVHEVERALDLARAAGFELPPGDDGRLAMRASDTDALADLPRPYVVVHPGASVPARAPRPADAAALVVELARRGRRVVVTGGPGETALTAQVAGDTGLDLGGRTDLATLAAVLEAAQCVVVGNTGPAHLAAAVGTPVVSLFAPVVPLERWHPWGVPLRVLGDQQAPCRGSGARECPVAGHPCLSSDPITVADAVDELTPPQTAQAPQSPGRSVVSA